MFRNQCSQEFLLLSIKKVILLIFESHNTMEYIKGQKKQYILFNLDLIK